MDGNTSRREFLGVAAGAGAAVGIGGLAQARPRPQAGGGSVPKRLRILVLGGTGQTGPQFIRKALAHGHQVTMFNRGNRSDEMFPEVENLIGDRYPERGDGLKSLEEAVKAGRRWDVVLDVW
ncbi:MAG: twin-arginine translocation signal domain-containing protein, partial [Phycisphaerales bacterium]|nr:twin-arginine translocation signal domain-containing protein [Phycisphaerales bacterium]